jgi:ABC-type nitrate/sulfonate/bicarbonate transport system permease component
VSPTVLPPPSSVAQATRDDWDTLRVDTWVTLQETGFGLLLALAVALWVGVAIDRFAWVRRGVYPLCVTLQTIPIVAIAPLMVIWFGIGLLPKVLLIALSAFFPIAVGLVQGLASTDEDAMNLLRTMRATRLQLLLRVRLPSALPQLFTGIKITVTYAVVAAVLAEVVGAFDGLGRYMQESRNAFRTDLVIGAAAITTLLTLALFGLVLLVERLVMPWYRPARGHRRW